MASNAIVSKIDDRDTSITYSTGWGQAGSTNEFDGTTTSTSLRGSTALVNFIGVGIAVFGTVPEGSGSPPASSYTIDGGTSILYSAPVTSSIIYSQQFFQSPNLTQGQHALVISDLGGNTLFLDYILITSVPAPTTTSSIVTSTVTQTVNTMTTSTVILTSTSTLAVPPPTITSEATISRAAVTTGKWAIAGVSVAVVIVILLSVLSCCLWKRRNKNRPLAPVQTTNTDQGQDGARY